MTEEETSNTYTMLPWEQLPLKARRNRKHMYNYLKSVFDPETTDES